MSEYIFNPEDVEISTYPNQDYGGQQVGSVSSGVRVEHKELGLIIISQHLRSQLRNKEFALKILNEAIKESIE